MNEALPVWKCTETVPLEKVYVGDVRSFECSGESIGYADKDYELNIDLENEYQVKLLEVVDWQPESVQIKITHYQAGSYEVPWFEVVGRSESNETHGFRVEAASYKVESVLAGQQKPEVKQPNGPFMVKQFPYEWSVLGVLLLFLLFFGFRKLWIQVKLSKSKMAFQKKGQQLSQTNLAFHSSGQSLKPYPLYCKSWRFLKNEFEANEISASKALTELNILGQQYFESEMGLMFEGWKPGFILKEAKKSKSSFVQKSLKEFLKSQKTLVDIEKNIADYSFYDVQQLFRDSFDLIQKTHKGVST